MQVQDKLTFWVLTALLVIALLSVICCCCGTGVGAVMVWRKADLISPVVSGSVTPVGVTPLVPATGVFSPKATPTPTVGGLRSTFITATPSRSWRLVTATPTPLGEGRGVPLPTATATFAPPVAASPSISVSEEAEETLLAITRAEIPERDLYDLAVRFMGVSPDTPRVASTTNPDYPVGTRRLFHVSNVDTDEQFDIYAILRYKTDHVYMWVEEGAEVNEKRLQAAADLFEEHTYPTNRAFFGSEPSPGVDGDPHLSILHARGLGGTVAGYFSSADSIVQEVRPDSNEMEMFYINLDNIFVGDDFYNGVLAHEFQHMIHWNNDLNEETWLNEGCSELAMALNDRAYPGGHYDVGGSHYDYLRRPDTQLTAWPEGTAGDASANYGAAYLFMEYFLGRFGEEATQALVAHPENGMESVDAVLQELGVSFTHKELFADWAAANLLDDPDAGEIYAYDVLDLPSPRLEDKVKVEDDPVTESGTVHQYGVDYIGIDSRQPVRLTFRGSTESRLLDTEAHSGQYIWWSNRADESDSRLTRVVDLRGVTEAELRFWTWYHIEKDWDYAYVVVGVPLGGDTLPEVLDGETARERVAWVILDDATLGCTTDNPNNNNLGCGFTGKSGGWKQLSADLTPFVGKEIALRFEYVTDAAVNQPGFAVDDVEVVADGRSLFRDDVEGGAHAWVAEGFVRHANVIPQEWIVQLVIYNEVPDVEPLLLPNGATEGEWLIPFNATVHRATLIVSAVAPSTTEVASYEFTLKPEP